MVELEPQKYASFHDLKDKSIFITGGGSGIGAAITEGFMAQGAKVAFVQRSDGGDFCEQMAAKFGVSPLFLPCDITNIEKLKSCVDEAAKAHGGLDILVNNAANDQRHETLDVDEEFWDWSQAINLKAYFFACQAAIAKMKQNGAGGAIVNFSSISYLMGLSGYPSYATANAAIMGLTRSLAREFGPYKIRVNAIAPGWVMTQKQLDQWATPEALAEHMERQALKEHLVPQDVVDAVLFLASQTSRMMTGQLLAVDGGVVATG